MDRYAGALSLYARQWCASPDDVVQEAFIKLGGMSSPPPTVGAWLFHFVRQRAISAGRSDRRRKRHEQRAAQAGPGAGWFEHDPSASLDADAAVTALARLASDEREIIVAHLWGGLTFAEIGALMKSSAATAHRRYASGIEALRRALEDNWQMNETKPPAPSRGDSPG
ncbi:MAG TPA: sigma-70 family RNA polymerase sigma factor [Planctomycetia bacterium]|nr:sigma-70 family RNA polymerase sigma factor [Planctomycetia bacterium]